MNILNPSFSSNVAQFFVGPNSKICCRRTELLRYCGNQPIPLRLCHILSPADAFFPAQLIRSAPIPFQARAIATFLRDLAEAGKSHHECQTCNVCATHGEKFTTKTACIQVSPWKRLP